MGTLFALAESVARGFMRDDGTMPPIVMALNEKDSVIMYLHGNMRDGLEKDMFFHMARVLCVAENAKAVVLVNEAWMAREDELLPGEQPRESVFRKEFIILAGQSRSGYVLRNLPIVRDGNGKFFNLGDAEDVLPVTEVEGREVRFSRILPPSEPPAEIRELARMAIALRGLKIKKL